MIEYWLMLLLLAYGEPTEGKASVFGGRADKHRGKKTYCLSPPRKVERKDWGIATRYAPDGRSRGKCGELILVILLRTGEWALVPRIGSGPYGAIVDEVPSHYDGPMKQRDDGRWWYVKKYRRRDKYGNEWPGRWIGVADLTYAVAKHLGHNEGKEPVVMYRVGYGNP